MFGVMLTRRGLEFELVGRPEKHIAKLTSTQGPALLPLPKKNCADQERGWAVRVGKALIILEGTLGDGDVASFALLLPVASERNGVSRNRTRDKKSPPKKARQMIDVTKTKCKSDITKKNLHSPNRDSPYDRELCFRQLILTIALYH